MKAIYLAEDSSFDAKFFRMALEELHQDYSLVRFDDGVELMDKLHHEDTIPDIIFLDINMPRKNGLKSLTEIRSSHEFKDIPVIIFSTTDTAEEIKLMYDAGANLFVQKPLRLELWKEVIERAISTIFFSGKQKLPLENFFIK